MPWPLHVANPAASVETCITGGLPDCHLASWQVDAPQHNDTFACVPQVARVTVLGKDGVKHEYFATLAGAFRPKDLVVLKINADPKDLQPATLGNSSEVKVGQQCLAIGSPFGFDHSLTTGAVSGLNRVIQSQVGALPCHLYWDLITVSRLAQRFESRH